MAPRLRIPHCLSQYEEGDTYCNGDPKASTRFEKQSCLWRDKCGAFRLYLDSGRSEVADDYLDADKKDPDLAVAVDGNTVFNRLLINQVRRFGLVEGKQTRDPARRAVEAKTKQVVEAKRRKRRKKRGPPKRARRRALKTLRRQAAEKRPLLKRLVRIFCFELDRNLTRNHFAKRNDAMLPGELHLDSSFDKGRAMILCRTISGPDKPVARMRFKPRLVTLNVSIPVSVDKLNGLPPKAQIKIQPYYSGSFSSVMKGLDERGVVIGAEFVAKLVNDGLIEIPRLPK